MLRRPIDRYKSRCVSRGVLGRRDCVRPEYIPHAQDPMLHCALMRPGRSYLRMGTHPYGHDVCVCVDVVSGAVWGTRSVRVLA